MLIAEVRTRAFLASLVPIIVNTVLNEHQLVLDIVAFVAMGDFPRSRLGEKQRGKILASWVSRKMRTIAQFSIRDPDAEGSIGTVVPEDHFARRGSTQSGNALGAASLHPGGSSLRNVQSVINMTEPIAEQDGHLTVQTQARSLSMTDVNTTAYEGMNDETPTMEHQQQPLNLNTTLDYSPVGPYTAASELPEHGRYDGRGGGYDDSQYARGDETEWQTSATYQPGDGGYPEWPSSDQHAHTNYDDHDHDHNAAEDDSPVEMPKPLGTLRVANGGGGTSSPLSEEGSDWGKEALKDLNLGK